MYNHFQTQHPYSGGHYLYLRFWDRFHQNELKVQVSGTGDAGEPTISWENHIEAKIGKGKKDHFALKWPKTWGWKSEFILWWTGPRLYWYAQVHNHWKERNDHHTSRCATSWNKKLTNCGKPRSVDCCNCWGAYWISGQIQEACCDGGSELVPGYNWWI